MLFLLPLVVRLLPACSSSQPLTRRPKIWRSWSSNNSYACCTARLAAPGSPPSTGSCTQRQAARFPGSGGRRCSWSRPRRCCTGTASSCDACGPTATNVSLAGHHSTPRSSRWCCGWQGRTHAGVAYGSAGSCASSDPGGRHDHQDAAATPRAGPGAAAPRADLDAVPQSPGRGMVACDLFTVETIWLQTPVRAVLCAQETGGRSNVGVDHQSQARRRLPVEVRSG